MRTLFASALEKLATKDKKIIFLTGDLGFHAFEKIKKTLEKRFINAGVAEHNMVTAAAGLSYAGFKPWIYSIAPFVTIKVLEELRNDICLDRRNVKVVGLGGGYDYGIAGPTHHALSDVSLMLSLPSMHVYAPAIKEDVDPIVNKMYHSRLPSYLRLTKAHECFVAIPPYSSVRHIQKGSNLTLIVFGSIIGKVSSVIERFKGKVDVWLITELPVAIPRALITSIKNTRKVCIIEEHNSRGALGQHLTQLIIDKKIRVKKFIHLSAKGYISKKYGSRDFYLKESGLDEKSILKILEANV